MIKSILFMGATAMRLLYSDVEEVKEVKVVTEYHEIVSIRSNEIRGEFVEGSGEGIFYYKQDFEEMGIDEIEVGDVVEISWTEEDFYNEEWEDIYSLKIIE